jgi:hypothetical protein
LRTSKEYEVKEKFLLPPRRLSVVEARRLVAGPLERLLPPVTTTEVKAGYASLGQWRLWRDAFCMFLTTGLPYYGLLGLFGKPAVLPWIFLFFKGFTSFHPVWTPVGLLGIACLVALSIPVVRRQRQSRRLGKAHHPLLRPVQSTLTFVIGSEQWSAGQKWRASCLYSLSLQMGVGFFPPFTLLSAVVTGRMFILYYEHQLVRSGSCETAANYVSSLRQARMVIAVVVTLCVSVVAAL